MDQLLIGTLQSRINQLLIANFDYLNISLLTKMVLYFFQVNGRTHRTFPPPIRGGEFSNNKNLLHFWIIKLIFYNDFLSNLDDICILHHWYLYNHVWSPQSSLYTIGWCLERNHTKQMLNMIQDIDLPYKIMGMWNTQFFRSIVLLFWKNRTYLLIAEELMKKWK